MCDLADIPQAAAISGATQLGLFESDGTLLWSHAILRTVAQPSAEGRAFDLAFSADGSAVVFGPMVIATKDGAVSEVSVSAGDAPGATIDTARTVSIAGAEADLDLPADSVPFTRLQIALCADGRRLATLSCRLSGAGDIRALLQIWDKDSGALRAP